MKALISMLSILGLLSFSVACSREAEDVRGIQREEAFENDGMIERDSYEALPAEEEAGILEEEEGMIED